ncbi:L-rhamnose mutarotase [Aridibaculum aurantiacum]|uniref:L-rhamnose mutarotase n=1 Tax=Aridibaculum aurantiacum TaxID=2810307 RepID=UPI001A97A6AE|nr:L-rhamnose mutarotase [Aridibaculum aurantiacum]
MMRYCFTLDLKDDPQLIKEYEEHHKHVWPEVLSNITRSGIQQMQIYRLHTRLFMIMDVQDGFSFEYKSTLDKASSKVQEWEQLMWKYQEPLPLAKPGEKWMLMEKLFDLEEQVVTKEE